MSPITCFECGNQVSADAETCLHCGAPTNLPALRATEECPPAFGGPRHPSSPGTETIATSLGHPTPETHTPRKSDAGFQPQPEHPVRSSRRGTLSRDTFRLLLLATFLTRVVGAFTATLTVSTLPEPLKLYVLREATDASVATSVYGMALFLGVFIGIFGLFIFWTPARLIFLVITGIAIASTLFHGPTVISSSGAVLEEVKIILSGLVLGIIYFSPIKYEFSRTEQKEGTG